MFKQQANRIVFLKSDPKDYVLFLFANDKILFLSLDTTSISARVAMLMT